MIKKDRKVFTKCVTVVTHYKPRICAGRQSSYVYYKIRLYGAVVGSRSKGGKLIWRPIRDLSRNYSCPSVAEIIARKYSEKNNVVFLRNIKCGAEAEEALGAILE